MTVIRLLCVVAVAFAAYWFGFRGGCGTRGAIACPDPALEEGVGVTLEARKICPRSGYLCDERNSNFQIARWQLDKGKLRVRIGLPDFVDPPSARRIRDAAIEGIMEWNGHPFPIVIDSARFTVRFWDIGVVWFPGGGGGHARMGGETDGKRFIFSVDGLQIIVPPVLKGAQPVLTPDSDPAVFIAQMDKLAAGGQPMGDAYLAQIKATAMHEMGHTLGLMHSNSESDIMFPVYHPGKTKVRLSERDLATVDALYSLPNGALVR